MVEISIGWAVWALMFLILGVFTLGMQAGEANTSRRTGVIRISANSDGGYMLAFVAIMAFIALAFVAVSPADRLQERFDRNKSSATEQKVP